MKNKQYEADRNSNKTVHIPTEYKRQFTQNRTPSLNHTTHVTLDKHIQPNLRKENSLCRIACTPLKLLIASFQESRQKQPDQSGLQKHGIFLTLPTAHSASDRKRKLRTHR
jgi:hypothetical protein